MASALATIRAAQKDADRRRVVRVASEALRGFGATVARAAVQAYRTGDDPAAAVRGRVEALNETITDALVVADLQARERMLIARKYKSRIALARAVPIEVEAMQKRIQLSDRELARLREVYGNVAYDSTGGISRRVTQATIRAVNEALTQGLTTDAGADLVREAMDAAGVGPRNPYVYESIFRTEVAKAYAASQWHTNEVPAVDSILWGYEYVTVGDDRVRPAHAAMDGVRRRKDDPFWQRWFPPNGYSCRCTAVEIFVDDPAGMRRETAVQDGLEPDAGFAFNPGRAIAA